MKVISFSALFPKIFEIYCFFELVLFPQSTY